jgi:Ca-activated chloride channel family protein
MTDGYIGNEREVIGLTEREIGRARIYGFGVGSSVNRHLLDEVSYVGRGAAEYLRPNEDPSAMIARFYERISRPYLTEIEIDWGSLAVSDVLPRPTRDLSALEPLLVLGRFRGAGTSTVTLKGKLAGKPFAQRMNVTLPDAPSGNVALSRIWAREKIAQLTREGTRGGSRAEEITRVALAHHLVSQYTSLVAIDATSGPARAPGFPMLVSQPSEAPEGVDLSHAGGTYASVPEPAPPAMNAQEADEARAPTTIAYAPASPRQSRGSCAACQVGAPHGARAGAILSLAGLVVLALRRKKPS